MGGGKTEIFPYLFPRMPPHMARRFVCKSSYLVHHNQLLQNDPNHS